MTKPLARSPLILHTEQLGPTQGKDLILLHGLFGDLDNWRTIAKALAEHYRITLIDAPNHGQSPHTELLDYPLFAADLAFTLKQLGVRSAQLLGHSMGGKAMMQLALDKPKDLEIEQLFIIDIAPRQYPAHHDKIFQGLQAIDPATLQSRTQANTALTEYEPNPAIRSFLLKNLRRASNGTGYEWRIPITTLHQQYPALIAAIDSENRFDGPAWFIKGEQSDYIQRSDRDPILQLFPNAAMKMVEGAGHWVHAERPGEFRDLVVSLLE